MALLLIVSLTSSVGSVGAVGGFGAPQMLPIRHAEDPELSPSVNNARFPSITIDETETAHIVWVQGGTPSSGSATLDVYYMRGVVTGDGTAIAWEIPQLLAQGAGSNSNPRVAVDRQGVVHVLYGIGRDIFYLHNVRRGLPDSWQTPELVSFSPPGHHSLALVLDANGQPFAVWCEGVGYDTIAAVMYSVRLDTNRWLPAVIVSDVTYLTKDVHVAIQGVGESATIHVLYGTQMGDTGPFLIGYSRVSFYGDWEGQDLTEHFQQGYGVEPALAMDRATGVLFAVFVRSHGDFNHRYQLYPSYSLVFTLSRDGGHTWEDYQTIRSERGIWIGEPWLVAEQHEIFLTGVQRVLRGNALRDTGIYYQTFTPTFTSSTGPMHVNGTEAGDRPVLALGRRSAALVWLEASTMYYAVGARVDLPSQAEPLPPSPFPPTIVYLPWVQHQ